jgi:hypothetical protein
MGTDIDIFSIGGDWVTPLSASRIEIRPSGTGEPVGTVCGQNGAEQVLDTRNRLPKTRRNRQGREKTGPR